MFGRDRDVFGVKAVLRVSEVVGIDDVAWCESAHARADGDNRARPIRAEHVVNAGRGDEPLIKLRFRCSNCGSRLTDWVVTAKNTGPQLQVGRPARCSSRVVSLT